MEDMVYISAEQATDWCVKLMTKTCKLSKDEAKIVAEVLVEANMRGVESHGINFLRHYAQQFSRIETRPIHIVSETSTSAVVDGGDNMGILVSVKAMNIAIEKAAQHGVGVVAVRNSNHFGAAAHYALLAAKKDMVGISMTNAVKRLAPWGGVEALLGNNPFAVAVPGNKFPVVLDMANSVVAFQKVATYAREGQTLPEGWALDKNGEPTTDAKAALSGFLMPVGGYKGIGLSVIIDILCGILSQNGTAEAIRELEEYDQPRKIGHLFIVVKISDFVEPEKFRALLDAYIDRFHGVPKKAGVNNLYLPGEIEHAKEQACLKSGIAFSKAAIKQLNDLSDELGVDKLA